MKARLELAKSELSESVLFDYRIVNDDLDRAVREVADIINKIKGERKC